MAAVDLSPSWAPHAHAHRRGHSASSSTFRFPAARQQRSLDPIPNDEDGQLADPPATAAPAPSFHAAKIKPYLRKLSLRDGSSTAPVDLSRPAAENESIAALGFYDESRSASELGGFVAGAASRSRHQRSASNTSNFSTSSRPNPPLAFPLRHTPRPYTPPIARSYTASSLVDSDDSDDVDHGPAPDDELRTHQRSLDQSHRSGSLGELPTAPHTAHLQSSSSLTRLNNASQTSLPTSRSRGDTLRSVDTATVPSSTRTSLDKAIGFFRGTATNTATSSLKEEVSAADPAAARAASIQLARIRYAEREEAKERKAEKDALRARDKANRKRAQREERQRRRSGSSARSPAAAAAGASGGLPMGSSSEKLGLIGRAYDEYQPAHLRTLPAHVPTAAATAAAAGTLVTKDAQAAGGKPPASSIKVRWLGFVAWFRTRLLRIKRSMTSGG
jgi:hypothetical protein